MVYLLPFGIMALWMVGGQWVKGARRFGVPGLTILAGLWEVLRSKKDDGKRRWYFFIFLVQVGILAMGYGVDSWLTRILKKDLTVRIVYGILMSIPYGVYIGVSHEPFYKYLVILAALVTAFSIRAGKFFSIKSFDFLIEDVIRSLTVGYSTLWLIK